MKEQHQRLALVTSRDIVKLNAIGFHILMDSIGLVLQDLWWSCIDGKTACATIKQMKGVQTDKCKYKYSADCAGLAGGCIRNS